MTNCHRFCQYLLVEIMKDVRKQFTPIQIKSAWAWGDGRDFEFHGPNGEYLYNLRQADCLWGAKAEGWSQLLALRETSCPICKAQPGEDCVRSGHSPVESWSNGVHSDRANKEVA